MAFSQDVLDDGSIRSYRDGRHPKHRGPVINYKAEVFPTNMDHYAHVVDS